MDVGAMKLGRTLEEMSGDLLSAEDREANAAIDAAAAAARTLGFLSTELHDDAAAHFVLAFAPESAALAAKLRELLAAFGYTVHAATDPDLATIQGAVVVVPIISDQYVGRA